ncbi:T9SS type A sorting domain-containing protein [Winogradskyella sp.]|uniref:T9SS type A sorting domain-containing protein n=1 Tax=Winogradskyella sp. TaxID=1883156 RepID=UPI00260EA3BF|nr:T9SS type A sorting domain-containing protein [Winogradskyella sp.]
MKKKLLFLTLLGFALQMTAQNHVLSSGSDSESSAGKVTYSVGLIHYKEATGTGGSLSVGSQIPFEVSETLSIDEFNNLTLKVFPNPTENFLNVHLNSVDDFTYQIIDLSGRTVTSGELNTLQSKIELTSLETSIYIFNILKDNTIVKSFKISKK